MNANKPRFSSNKSGDFVPPLPSVSPRVSAGRWGLLLLCCFLFFFRLGNAPIFDLDEALYVTCSQQMLRSGDWITPRLNTRMPDRLGQTGVPFFEKPILIYWVTAGSLRTFGVSEWAARLPVALIALLTTGLVAVMGSRWWGERTGLLCGLVYATAPMTIYDARQVTTDGLLALWFTVAMAAFWQVARCSDDKRGGAVRNGWSGIFWLACGLGVLTKGAIGLVLPGLVIAPFLLLRTLALRVSLQRRRVRFHCGWNGRQPLLASLLRLRPLLGLLLVFALTAPWHWQVWRAGGRDAQGRTWVQEYVGRQHVGRFRGGDTVHNAPLPSYALYFLIFFFPWSCLAPAAFRFRGAVSGGEGLRGEVSHKGAETQREDGEKVGKAEENGAVGQWGSGSVPPLTDVSSADVRRFLLIWFWAIFGFFTLGAAKLPAYVAPAYPAAALLIGHWLNPVLFGAGTGGDFANGSLKSLRRGVVGMLIAAALLVVGAILLPRFSRSSAPIAPDIVALARHITLLLLLGTGAAWLCLQRTGAKSGPQNQRAGRRVGLAALVAMMILVVIVGTTEGFAVAAREILRPYQQIATDAREDALRGIPVIFYHIVPRRPSMNYYAGYAPYERKEEPLLPFARSLLADRPGGVDVITSQAAYEQALQPELAAAPDVRATIVGTRSGSDPGGTWLLLRLRASPGL